MQEAQGAPMTDADKDGHIVYLDDRQRAGKMAPAKKKVADSCKSAVD